MVCWIILYRHDRAQHSAQSLHVSRKLNLLLCGYLSLSREQQLKRGLIVGNSGRLEDYIAPLLAQFT